MLCSKTCTWNFQQDLLTSMGKQSRLHMSKIKLKPITGNPTHASFVHTPLFFHTSSQQMIPEWHYTHFL